MIGTTYLHGDGHVAYVVTAMSDIEVILTSVFNGRAVDISRESFDSFVANDDLVPVAVAARPTDLEEHV